MLPIRVDVWRPLSGFIKNSMARGGVDSLLRNTKSTRSAQPCTSSFLHKVYNTLLGKEMANGGIKYQMCRLSEIYNGWNKVR